MTQMNTSPIQIGDVQVVGINRVEMNLALNIALDCKPDELVLLSAKVEASEKLQRAFHYLVAEGFVIPSPLTRWTIQVFAQSKFNQ